MRPMVAAAALIALLSACGANPPDPCGLVTLDELMAETGMAYVLEGQVGTVGSVDKVCWWSSVNPEGFLLSVAVEPWSDNGNWEWQLRTKGAHAVQGLGDGAILSTGDPMWPIWLQTRQAGWELTLGGRCVAGLEGDCTKRFIDLASQALARLPGAPVR
jgi:hypothetical protein